MTTALYKRVQTWFTKRMPATKTRENIYDKAQRILSDPARVRTRTSSGTDYWTGEVDGDTGTYTVASISSTFAHKHGLDGAKVACRCRAGRKPMLCSHMIVGEEMRLRGEAE
jgi:hypothetical protein